MQETSDLLNRHTTLVTTNMDLKQLQRANTEEMEQVRAEMTAMLKRRADEILHKNNHIAQLKKQLESIRLKAADQEAVKDSSLQVTSQNTLEYGQVRLGFVAPCFLSLCFQACKIAHDPAPLNIDVF